MYYQNPLILKLFTPSPSPDPLPEPVNLVSDPGQTIVYIVFFIDCYAHYYCGHDQSKDRKKADHLSSTKFNFDSHTMVDITGQN